jgi:uncharacterized protein YegL
MSGDPIQAINQGVKALVAELKSEPYAIETVYLSVITFNSTAQQVCPLTELMTFKEPTLIACGATSMGAALKLLLKCFEQEVNKPSDTQKGDWKPMVFLLTDGTPTDSWESAAEELRKKNIANIIACAAGTGADEYMLKKITDSVVKLNNLQPDDLKAYFKWVSQSIKQTSQSVAQVMADDQSITLPSPPPFLITIP